MSHQSMKQMAAQMREMCNSLQAARKENADPNKEKRRRCQIKRIQHGPKSRYTLANCINISKVFHAPRQASEPNLAAPTTSKKKPSRNKKKQTTQQLCLPWCSSNIKSSSTKWDSAIIRISKCRISQWSKWRLKWEKCAIVYRRQGKRMPTPTRRRDAAAKSKESNASNRESKIV